MATLEASGLVVRYGQVTAVHGIDLRLEQGQVVGLLGSNGAGKTSTLNALSGALKPAGGRITFDGEDITGRPSQMLAFGRALMSEPKVLLLDEPSMGLAPIMVDRIIEAVASIAERGLSILMVEQNAAVAFELATYAYVLEQGEVILEGSVDAVRNDPLVLRAFLGLEAAPTT
jgi:branched-chain amino acid transport system ATP-binding protein